MFLNEFHPFSSTSSAFLEPLAMSREAQAQVASAAAHAATHGEGHGEGHAVAGGAGRGVELPREADHLSAWGLHVTKQKMRESTSLQQKNTLTYIDRFYSRGQKLKSAWWWWSTGRRRWQLVEPQKCECFLSEKWEMSCPRFLHLF